MTNESAALPHIICVARVSKDRSWEKTGRLGTHTTVTVALLPSQFHLTHSKTEQFWCFLVTIDFHCKLLYL